MSVRSAVRGRLQSMPWWGQIGLIWLAAVVALSIAGLVGVRVLDLREGYDPIIGIAPGSLAGVWARWDSPYYVNIAEHGYAAVPYAMGYFPLFPLATAILSRVTGWPAVTAGVIIAQLCYLAALLMFYRLARLIRDEHGFALRAAIAMAVFPTSFFFLAMYAESMALAFGVLSVYLALRARWAWSGLALGLAAAARPVGWLLIIVLVVEFLRRRQFDWRSLASLAAGLALSVSGVAIYVLYLYSLTGTFFAITQAQALWLRSWAWPWETLFKSVALVFTGNGVQGDWFLYTMNLVDLSFTGLGLGLTILAFKRLPLSLSLYLAGTFAFLLFTQGLPEVPLWGMSRWVASAFPIYLVIAAPAERRLPVRLMAAVSACVMAGLMAWWASGRWVG